MIVATWNVNSIRVRLPQLTAWLARAKPDVVCLQETKVVDADFPHGELEAAGYAHRAVHGQKTYNGVALISRAPLADVVLGFADGEPDPQTRLVRATVGGVRVVNGYFPNGAPLGSDKYLYKQRFYDRLRADLDAHERPDVPLVVCGDFNVAPEDVDTHDPFEAGDDLLCSPPERAAYFRLQAFGLVDAFRHKQPFAQQFTWWDYRMQAYRYNKGFRIDHVLVTKPLAPRVARCWVDESTRKLDQPSDHAPVLVELRGP